MQNKPIFSRSLLRDFLPENAIIVEAGAHNGRDTIKLSRLFASGTIYAFEPLPAAFHELKEATQHYSNVHCFNVALSNYCGYATMHTTTGRFRATSSLLEPHKITQEHTDVIYQTIEVPVTTLDAWAQENNITTIDGMWLDAQGAELAILQGAQHIISKISLLFLEVSTAERYKNMPLLHDIKQWLSNHHFKIIIEHLHHDTWGNVLAIKSK